MQTIALKCPGCGAGLEVANQLDNFGCGYCGTAVRVVRGGGTVSLVAETLTRIQTGTDRTAAELALVRLKSELDAIQIKIVRTDFPPSPTIGPFIPKVVPGRLEMHVRTILSFVVAAVFAKFLLGNWWTFLIVTLGLIWLVRAVFRYKKGIDEEKLKFAEAVSMQRQRHREKLSQIQTLLDELNAEEKSIFDQIKANEAIVRRPIS